ncbi:VQ motif-containing protein [Actinidia chinensis var. chinensis]|uniref:VQ motif-containing protein n=1 Tax=Actinidia chinensis var. chinensis TaxID=1590841 RepID=A0A2R6RG65_ACTCC|nr:VQ motif-containing protein [Actinidia chinensis var. chinensis]
MAGASHEPVKVVYINTRFIKTDPLSFKSVVQSLTGKDVSSGKQENSFVGGKRKKYGGHSGSGGGGGGGGVLCKDLAIMEFERLLELPPVEELKWLY